MEKELQKTTLRICIFADTWEDAEYYYEQFYQYNKDIVLIPGKNRLILNDGTIIEKFGATQGELHYLTGTYYDQIIWCIKNPKNIRWKDWYVKKPKTIDLNEVIDALSKSQVPMAYRILLFEEE